MAAFRPAALLAAALAAASPAFAQEAPPPGPAAAPQSAPESPTPQSPESDVTVTGTLERDREVRDFVGALTQVPMTRAIGRFEDAICPTVFGISGQQRAAAIARMRRVAVAVGLRLGRDGCRPNVLLMVTRDKRALIQTLVSRYPHFFGEDENSPRRVLAEAGPAAAWHATAEVNADGSEIDQQGAHAVNRTTRRLSRITVATRPAFFAAAVVVERQAIYGLSVNQLADYAMMRALARTDPHRLSGDTRRSILTVLEAPVGSEIPIGLTRWDLGFLRGLYASPANLAAPQQRSGIRERVEAELDRPEGSRN